MAYLEVPQYSDLCALFSLSREHHGDLRNESTHLLSVTGDSCTTLSQRTVQVISNAHCDQLSGQTGEACSMSIQLEGSALRCWQTLSDALRLTSVR